MQRPTVKHVQHTDTHVVTQALAQSDAQQSRTFGGYQAKHRKSGLYRTHTAGKRAKHAALMEHGRQHESASEGTEKRTP